MQGFFLAPTVTASAVKAAVFGASLYEKLGFNCVPKGNEDRYDVIQAIELKSEKGMCAFSNGIQSASPVDSYVTPVPSDMPGYESKVIMAAGTFIQGASIEMSCDGPIREPYSIYYQGGLTWPSAKFGMISSLQKLVDANLVNIDTLC
jgi:hypothetical protein